jgi:hypothetical protein
VENFIVSNRRASVLATLPRLGINREEAAAYVGIGATLFDRLVEEGMMPQPRLPSGSRMVWDIDEVATAFRQLPRRGEQTAKASGNPWD